jgi:RNA polymerase sigma factor (TIGR02999 family)
MPNQDCQSHSPQDDQGRPASPAEKLDLNQLVEQKYDELKRLARKMRWRDPRASLTATALLGEVYVRLSRKPGDFDGKTEREVLAIIANVMWEILVDQARSKQALKRGGARQIVSLTEGPDLLDHVDALPREDILTLKTARADLRREDPRAAEVFDLRFSVGLTTDETAATLGLSRSTVERESRAARGFFIAALRPRKQQGL